MKVDPKLVRATVIAALRAALSCDPDAETIDAMAREIDPGAWRDDPYSSDGGNHRRFVAKQKAIAAYRALPLWQALYGGDK